MTRPDTTLKILKPVLGNQVWNNVTELLECLYFPPCVGTYGVMDISSLEMDTATCTRLFAFHIAKGINPTILLPTMSKIVGQNGIFSLGMATGLEEKFCIQTY